MPDLDIDTEVAAATSADTFDALDFFSDASLPTATVTLYRDTAAAYRLAEIREAEKARELLDEEEGIGMTDDPGYTDEDEVTALTEQLNNSAVVFNLQALAPAARSALEKSARAKNVFVEGADNPAYWEMFNTNLVAKSIVKVTDARGRVDTNKWDNDRVLKFSEVTEPSEWAKLFAKVYTINFISDAIDQAVSADF